MGLFSNILEKLGIKKDKTSNNASASASGSAPASKPSTVGAGAGIKSQPKAKDDMAHGAARPAPKTMSDVDVVAKLEGLAKANPAQLNWKTSIVDLLKLLDLDSSGEARKELAIELGCPEDMKHGSTEMNVWLHKTVLKKIAENGGNIPQDLLD